MRAAVKSCDAVTAGWSIDPDPSPIDIPQHGGSGIGQILSIVIHDMNGDVDASLRLKINLNRIPRVRLIPDYLFESKTLTLEYEGNGRSWDDGKGDWTPG
jgi:hypothetical protein